MNEQQHDQQVQEATQSALEEIASMHEHAVDAVRQHYPAPKPKSRHSAPEDMLGSVDNSGGDTF